AGVVLACFALVGVLDSIHYRPLLPPAPGAEQQARVHSPITRSALDAVLNLTQLPNREQTYSAPLALYQFTKESWLEDGQVVRDYPRLRYAGVHLSEDAERQSDILRRSFTGLLAGLAAALAVGACLSALHGRRRGGMRAGWHWWWRESEAPWRTLWTTSAIIFVLAGVTL